MPVQASGFKTLGILCCKSNPITAKLWLDRCGYVPGEKIYFNAEVENLSRKTMRGTKVQIIEVREEKMYYHDVNMFVDYILMFFLENLFSRNAWDRIPRESYPRIHKRKIQSGSGMGKSSHHNSSCCLFKSPVLQYYRRILQHLGEII